jgi:8-oxo-dGDP phosphatase
MSRVLSADEVFDSNGDSNRISPAPLRACACRARDLVPLRCVLSEQVYAFGQCRGRDQATTADLDCAELVRADEVVDRPTAHAETSEEREGTQWKIYGERLVDENPFIRLSIASVGLPDGTEFEQYVMRMRRTATTVVLDDQDRVLLMWRHRFIVGRWVWELPGGYVDQAEDPAREVEEETGWRPLDKPEFVMTFQPMIGNADSPQDLYLARGAVPVACKRSILV